MSSSQGMCGRPSCCAWPMSEAGPPGKACCQTIITILSVAMMLRYSLSEPEAAQAIEDAVSRVLDQGLRTADIYSEGCKKVSTAEMGDAVLAALG